MKKVLPILILAFVAMSFINNVTTYHYPDFMMVYDKQIPKGTTAGCEAYYRGDFVCHATDYFSNLDSIAVKYMKGSGDQRKDTYTNFYARISDTTWKKYSSDKRLIGVITEHRTDTLVVQHYTSASDIVYYTVK